MVISCNKKIYICMYIHMYHLDKWRPSLFKAVVSTMQELFGKIEICSLRFLIKQINS